MPLTDAEIRELIAAGEKAMPPKWKMKQLCTEPIDTWVITGPRPNEALPLATNDTKRDVATVEGKVNAAFIAAFGTHGRAISEELLTARGLLRRTLTMLHEDNPASKLVDDIEAALEGTT